MGAFPPSLPPGSGAGPPPPMSGPPPALAALAGARPPAPGGGMGGMSQTILYFLAGLGFQNFAKSMKELRGNKEDGKKSQAGGLIQSLMASRAMPQAAVSPPAGSTPAMLAGGQSPSFLAMIAQLAAAANRNRGQA